MVKGELEQHMHNTKKIAYVGFVDKLLPSEATLTALAGLADKALVLKGYEEAVALNLAQLIQGRDRFYFASEIHPSSFELTNIADRIVANHARELGVEYCPHFTNDRIESGPKSVNNLFEARAAIVYSAIGAVGAGLSSAFMALSPEQKFFEKAATWFFGGISVAAIGNMLYNAADLLGFIDHRKEHAIEAELEASLINGALQAIAAEGEAETIQKLACLLPTGRALEGASGASVSGAAKEKQL